jgi:hypothetical protein
MGRFLMLLGLFLIALPFAVMGLEVLWAIVTGATGEARMAAGQLGVYVGFLTVIPGFILMIVGVVVWSITK